MTNVAPRFVPALPWVSAFPELNVRTYVRVGGKPGVFFFSLDAGNPLAVGAARTLLNLPYYSAAMTVDDATTARSHYASRRQSEPAAEFVARYRGLGDRAPAPRGTLEYFLTERYCLYAVDHRRQAYRLEIHHPPWPLESAEAEITQNTMADAAGIRLPSMAPLLHFVEAPGHGRAGRRRRFRSSSEFRSRFAVRFGAKFAVLVRFGLMIRSLCDLLTALLLSRANAPRRRSRCRRRVQTYLDEWRAAATFPGAAVGIVLKDGTAFAVTTGVSRSRRRRRPSRPTISSWRAAPARRSSPRSRCELIEAGRRSTSTRRFPSTSGNAAVVRAAAQRERHHRPACS